MNQFTIVGRIANDPKLGTTAHGKHYVRFHVAVRRDFKSKDNEYKTDFIPVVAWRTTAERIHDYCGKGSIVTINGRMMPMTYLPQGHARYNSIELVAESVGFQYLKRVPGRGADNEPQALINEALDPHSQEAPDSFGGADSVKESRMPYKTVAKEGALQ
ncbi:single-stranded DNA-binding protein [Salisediminibacterium beveridgei]|uniref:Single-stranded DNA-binding protein n=1 Tax=Salisediminibacterium beveridgei TaxID=632773 RepID=A0A1D7QSF8_9BACI|nr:single-stranded DNA-binding protein [Salisediminibacterium beveridgei]AOM81938.1 Single-stranded DNA-binding protein [Salisediminibacterium beveridgei]